VQGSAAPAEGLAEGFDEYLRGVGARGAAVTDADPAHALALSAQGERARDMHTHTHTHTCTHTHTHTHTHTRALAVVDEIPLHDPRWAESEGEGGEAGVGGRGEASLVVLQQLCGKQQRHARLLEYLRGVGQGALWAALTRTPHGTHALAAVLAHAEKAAFAVALRDMHTRDKQ
jgi:hypothetical protein